MTKELTHEELVELLFDFYERNETVQISRETSLAPACHIRPIHWIRKIFMRKPQSLNWSSNTIKEFELFLFNKHRKFRRVAIFNQIKTLADLLWLINNFIQIEKYGTTEE